MSEAFAFQPKMLGIICNWCCYGGADLCGVSRFPYPPYIRLVRVMCSGRVDPLHIFKAFANGEDAVFVGGCHLGDCHYVTHGNFNAYIMVQVCRKILGRIGVRPERLRIEWVSAGEGIRFANFMNAFAAEVEAMGPLGEGEGLDAETLRLDLEAALHLVPFMRLVLAQRMSLPAKTEEACHAFVESETFDRLFEDLFGGRLDQSRIMLLLREQPLSTGEIAERLGLKPADVSRHMNSSSREGWVRYDADRKQYALA